MLCTGYVSNLELVIPACTYSALNNNALSKLSSIQFFSPEIFKQ